MRLVIAVKRKGIKYKSPNDEDSFALSASVFFSSFFSLIISRKGERARSVTKNPCKPKKKEYIKFKERPKPSTSADLALEETKANMVFLRTLFLKDTKLIYSPAENLLECRRQIEEKAGTPADMLAFYHNGRRVQEVQVLENNATVDVTLVLGLKGGKGGFGSMLRALGAQIEKTTNKEACRDLSGRRLRDINEEERLKNYVANAAEREREKAEKKEVKLQKLRKIVDPKCDGGGKHEFHDPKYNREREAATERVHEAMEEAFKTIAGSATASAGSSSSSSDSEESRAGPSGASTKRKSELEPEGSKPKKALWIGDGLTESDLEDSSDEENAEADKKSLKP